MISYWLLLISVIIVIGSYFLLIMSRFSNNKRKLDNYTGFDVAKEVTSSYDDINIVSSTDIVFSCYDIKRNVIRLNTKNYDGSSYDDIVVASILAGFSLVNHENNNYFRFSFLFKKIRCVSVVSFVMMLLSYFITNIIDAKIGLVLFLILLVYQYMRYQIIVSVNSFIESNLDKKVVNKIKNMLVSYINFYKLSFIASLVMILRLIVIIIGM